MNFILAISAAGVVSCGGRKSLPLHQPKISVLFSFFSVYIFLRPFEIIDDILRNWN